MTVRRYIREKNTSMFDLMKGFFVHALNVWLSFK